MPCENSSFELMETDGTGLTGFDFQLRPVGCHQRLRPRAFELTVQGLCFLITSMAGLIRIQKSFPKSAALSSIRFPVRSTGCTIDKRRRFLKEKLGLRIHGPTRHSKSRAAVRHTAQTTTLQARFL